MCVAMCPSYFASMAVKVLVFYLWKWDLLWTYCIGVMVSDVIFLWIMSPLCHWCGWCSCLCSICTARSDWMKRGMKRAVRTFVKTSFAGKCIRWSSIRLFISFFPSCTLHICILRTIMVWQYCEIHIYCFHRKNCIFFLFFLPPPPFLPPIFPGKSWVSL